MRVVVVVITLSRVRQVGKTIVTMGRWVSERMKIGGTD